MTQSEIQKHIRALKNKDGQVRQHAAVALGINGPHTKEAVPALVKVLKDSEGAEVARQI